MASNEGTPVAAQRHTWRARNAGSPRSSRVLLRSSRSISDQASPEPWRSAQRMAKQIAIVRQTMRLGKYLASAGVASRRASEEIVRAGRVTVSGRTVTDPARDVASGDAVA